jgi:hypothetical protein
MPSRHMPSCAARRSGKELKAPLWLRRPSCFRLAVSKDRSLLASIGRNVVVGSLCTREKFGAWHPFAHPSDIAFSDDASMLAVKSTSGELVVLDPKSGIALHAHQNQREGEGCGVGFSPCGRYLVDGSWKGFVRVRQATSSTVEFEREFPGEMVSDLSRDQKGQTWLLQHQPIARAGDNSSPPTYLSLWSWPLRQPWAVFTLDRKRLIRSHLSPTGDRIAVIGYDDDSPWLEMSIRTIEGVSIAQRTLEIGGTGNSMRWSSDGRLIGVVEKGRFVVLEANTLEERLSVSAKFPSDLALLQDENLAVLGSWDGTSIHPLVAP